MNTSNNRIRIYSEISTELSCLSDSTLTNHIKNVKDLHSGIGGHSVLLTIAGTQVFVKKICLTDLEKQSDNMMSTANLFNLPLYYQYGIGSTGFSAWRELIAHIMTTNWVIAGMCPNFPLMYHWRVLSRVEAEPMNAEQHESLERDIKNWNNNQAIRNRLRAIHHASAKLLLFLEYIPQTLYQWLGIQLTTDEYTAASSLAFVEKNIKNTNAFINKHGLIHFDAHLQNILTDGKLLYFSDFGLALSSKFDLSKTEMEFFNQHATYDQCSMITSFLHCIITHLFGNDKWEVTLREYLDGKRGEISPAIASIIKRYGPIALTLDEFYDKLQNESKLALYPARVLEQLLTNIKQGEAC